MSHFNYDYELLKKRIIVVYGSLEAFAEAMGMNKRSLMNRLDKNKDWSVDEIYKAKELLEIPDSLAETYFFNRLEEGTAVQQKIKGYLDLNHIEYHTVYTDIGMSEYEFNQIMTGNRKLSADELFSICRTLDVSAEMFNPYRFSVEKLYFLHARLNQKIFKGELEAVIIHVGEELDFFEEDNNESFMNMTDPYIIRLDKSVLSDPTAPTFLYREMIHQYNHQKGIIDKDETGNNDDFRKTAEKFGMENEGYELSDKVKAIIDEEMLFYDCLCKQGIVLKSHIRKQPGA